MFLAAFFKIAGKWKQPKHLPTGKQNLVNNMLLNNQWAKKYLEANVNGNTTVQNLGTKQKQF